jgi:hypothetical protein
MNQTVALKEPSLFAGDEQNLSRAVALLSQHRFLGPLICSAIEGGYEFLIDPNIRAKAVHRPKTKDGPDPSIRFLPGRTCEQYAQSLCHELIHFAITRAGRVYGVRLTPIADIEMRQCEEAAVFAITSDLMYQVAHGINMVGNTTFTKLWDANLNTDFYTARAYAAHADNRDLAVQEAFRCFYTLPDEKFRQSYQSSSITAILRESEETLVNPRNFTENFNPSEFAKFLPAPYNKILAPCLAAMQPDDQQHLVLSIPLATDLETKFVARRAEKGIPLNWTVSVRDQGQTFMWSPRKGSLLAQRNSPPRVLSNAA